MTNRGNALRRLLRRPTEEQRADRDAWNARTAKIERAQRASRRRSARPGCSMLLAVALVVVSVRQ